MNRKQCPQCGLVNWDYDAVCRRCTHQFDAAQQAYEASLDAAQAAQATHFDSRAASANAHEEAQSSPRRRSFLSRLAIVIVLTAVALAAAYASLRISSDAVTPEEAQAVERAIAVLEARGFKSEAWMLRHVVSFRRTDNWWNNYVGHSDAYAATNFPFQIVTLYPEFFQVPYDDTERAAILLHESYHLRGKGEPAAFSGVWRTKWRLGWTQLRYGGSRVWQNTRELTTTYAPEMFQCGARGSDDCTEVASVR